MRTTICITIIFLRITCYAQELFSDTLLKEDFKILTKAICEVSPNLSLKEKASLYNYFNNRSEKLNGKTMSAIDFFRFLMDTKANTKLDEHGTISLSNKEMKTLLSNKKILFPLPIIILNNKLIINHNNVQIPYGSIISKINGVSISGLIDGLLREKNTAALRNLEQSFDVLFFIKYGAPKTFNITYTLPNSSVNETLKISPVSIKTRENIYSNTVYPLNQELLKNVINTRYFKNSDAYYIQLNSFNWKGETKNVYSAFRKQFSKIFKKIKKQKPKNLIIDLRYNRGGNMIIPGLFYSYISQGNFKEYMSLIVPDFKLPCKNNIYAIENNPINSKGVENLMTNFKKHFKKNNGYYENVFINNVKRFENKSSFNGDIYLLIGGRTFSAASYYTSLFKSHKRGKIVGEQIGGSHQNITAGKQIDYVLPNTKIRLSIPIAVLKFSQNLSINAPKQKITPNFLQTDAFKYQSFLKKEDWDLQTVFDLIKKD